MSNFQVSTEGHDALTDLANELLQVFENDPRLAGLDLIISIGDPSQKKVGLGAHLGGSHPSSPAEAVACVACSLAETLHQTFRNMPDVAALLREQVMRWATH